MWSIMVAMWSQWTTLLPFRQCTWFLVESRNAFQEDIKWYWSLPGFSEQATNTFIVRRRLDPWSTMYIHSPFPWLKISDLLNQISCSFEAVTTGMLCVNLLVMRKAHNGTSSVFSNCLPKIFFSSILFPELLRGNKITTANALSFTLWSVGSSHIGKCAARETGGIFLIHSPAIPRSESGCFDNSASRESSVTSALRSSWHWLLCFAILGLSAWNSSPIVLFFFSSNLLACVCGTLRRTFPHCWLRRLSPLNWNLSNVQSCSALCSEMIPSQMENTANCWMWSQILIESFFSLPTLLHQRSSRT